MNFGFFVDDDYDVVVAVAAIQILLIAPLAVAAGPCFVDTNNLCRMHTMDVNY